MAEVSEAALISGLTVTVVAFVLICCLFFSLAFQYYDLSINYAGLKESYAKLKESYVIQKFRFESYSMCGQLINKTQFGIYGVYRKDRYYCVWTQGRNESEVKTAINHEECHDFVHKDYEHFCK